MPPNGEELDLLEPVKTRQGSPSAARWEVGTGEGLWPTAVNKRPWTTADPAGKGTCFQAPYSYT